jgi:hypothetical protein
MGDHVLAQFRERDSHATGPDSEFERSSGTGELGQTVDRRPQHVRGEHAGA